MNLIILLSGSVGFGKATIAKELVAVSACANTPRSGYC
jgi:deoxyadenosine/deoxycytidine kinase